MKKKNGNQKLRIPHDYKGYGPSERRIATWLNSTVTGLEKLGHDAVCECSICYNFRKLRDAIAEQFVRGPGVVGRDGIKKELDKFNSQSPD